MFDINDTRFLWVSPDTLIDGNGSFEQPFDSIESALKKVEPGNTIILKSGLYDEDVTLQVSGSINKPIRIVADENAKVEILGSCWFFYDTSDFIVSGLTFKDAPHGAISVIGACERNRFENLHFINCGTSSKPSCTMYFGGSGAENNVVESCVFTRTKESIASIPDNAAVGLMVSEGDGTDGTVIKHHVFRRNRFDNYYHGIIVGSNDSNATLHSHIVEYNTITNSSSDGILIKCGDTLIRGNLIKNSSQSAIKISAGSYCIIENNRIENCSTGIAINGIGHTISNNSILNCANQAISACKAASEESIPATNLFIESNTCVNCGSTNIEGVGKISGILIEAGTTSIVSNNLIHGDGKPYHVSECDTIEKDTVPGNAHPKFVITENAASGTIESPEGFSLITAVFPASSEGNFENSSGFGAQGWVLKPEGFDPDMDNLDSDTNYIDANMTNDDDDIEVEDEDNDEVVDKQSSGDNDDEENVVQEKLFASFFSDFDAEEVPTLPPEEPWAD